MPCKWYPHQGCLETHTHLLHKSVQNLIILHPTLYLHLDMGTLLHMPHQPRWYSLHCKHCCTAYHQHHRPGCSLVCRQCQQLGGENNNLISLSFSLSYLAGRWKSTACSSRSTHRQNWSASNTVWRQSTPRKVSDRHTESLAGYSSVPPGSLELAGYQRCRPQDPRLVSKLELKKEGVGGAASSQLQVLLAGCWMKHIVIYV